MGCITPDVLRDGRVDTHVGDALPTTREQGASTDGANTAAGVPSTNEERLRALTNDRKPKARRTAGSKPANAGRHPGDLVDAVRERSNRDMGRDTPG